MMNGTIIQLTLVALGVGVMIGVVTGSTSSRRATMQALLAQQAATNDLLSRIHLVAPQNYQAHAQDVTQRSADHQ
jgi:predicted MFS family arabinose efflux permease